jgi:hypothetical protein
MAATALNALKNDRPVCKSSDHLFVPILEVTVPLLRCIHCNVFAYQETVKQLARNRAYREVKSCHASRQSLFLTGAGYG